MTNLYDLQPKPAPARAPESKKVKAGGAKYEDVTGEFTASELKYSLWYVRNKLVLRRALIVLLSVFIALTLGYSLWQMGAYLAGGYAQDKKLEAAAGFFYDYTGVKARYAPLPLRILSTQLLPGGVNKFDAVSLVVNPNRVWLAEVKYHFAVNGLATGERRAVLFPGQEGMIAVLGESAGDGTAELIFDEVNWRRISPHLVPDPAGWQAERLNFAVSDFGFSQAPGAAPANASVISFKAINNSAYGFVSPSFIVGLYSNESLVAVLPLAFDSWASLETKDVDLRSFVYSLRADAARLFPQINIYDPAAYLPPPR